MPRRCAPRNDMQKPAPLLHPHSRAQRAPIPAGKRPCSRKRLPVFCTSLRTSAHTGVAIRFPAGEPSKLAAAWANSEKLRICLRCCFPFCITARRTDCHVAALLAMTCRNPPRFCIPTAVHNVPPFPPENALAAVNACQSFACHCEPVRTLVWQSASPQESLASWLLLGQIRKSCGFALGAAFHFALLRGERIATSLRSSQ